MSIDIGSFIGLIISLLWIGLIYYVGNKNKKIAFFLMAYFYWIIVAVIFVLFPQIFQLLMLILSSWFIIIFLVIIVDQIIWSITLYEASGDENLVWFYIIYLIPFIGWFLYRITKENRTKKQKKKNKAFIVAGVCIIIALCVTIGLVI